MQTPTWHGGVAALSRSSRRVHDATAYSDPWASSLRRAPRLQLVQHDHDTHHYEHDEHEHDDYVDDDEDESMHSASNDANVDDDDDDMALATPSTWSAADARCMSVADGELFQLHAELCTRAHHTRHAQHVDEHTLHGDDNKDDNNNNNNNNNNNDDDDAWQQPSSLSLSSPYRHEGTHADDGDAMHAFHRRLSRGLGLRIDGDVLSYLHTPHPAATTTTATQTRSVTRGRCCALHHHRHGVCHNYNNSSGRSSRLCTPRDDNDDAAAAVAAADTTMTATPPARTTAASCYCTPPRPPLHPRPSLATAYAQQQHQQQQQQQSSPPSTVFACTPRRRDVRDDDDDDDACQATPLSRTRVARTHEAAVRSTPVMTTTATATMTPPMCTAASLQTPVRRCEGIVCSRAASSMLRSDDSSCYSSAAGGHDGISSCVYTTPSSITASPVLAMRCTCDARVSASYTRHTHHPCHRCRCAQHRVVPPPLLAASSSSSSVWRWPSATLVAQRAGVARMHATSMTTTTTMTPQLRRAAAAAAVPLSSSTRLLLELQRELTAKVRVRAHMSVLHWGCAGLLIALRGFVALYQGSVVQPSCVYKPPAGRIVVAVTSSSTITTTTTTTMTTTTTGYAATTTTTAADSGADGDERRCVYMCFAHDNGDVVVHEYAVVDASTALTATTTTTSACLLLPRCTTCIDAVAQAEPLAIRASDTYLLHTRTATLPRVTVVVAPQQQQQQQQRTQQQTQDCTATAAAATTSAVAARVTCMQLVRKALYVGRLDGVLAVYDVTQLPYVCVVDDSVANAHASAAAQPRAHAYVTPWRLSFAYVGDAVYHLDVREDGAYIAVGTWHSLRVYHAWQLQSVTVLPRATHNNSNSNTMTCHDTTATMTDDDDCVRVHVTPTTAARAAAAADGSVVVQQHTRTPVRAFAWLRTSDFCHRHDGSGDVCDDDDNDDDDSNDADSSGGAAAAAVCARGARGAALVYAGGDDACDVCVYDVAARRTVARYCVHATIYRLVRSRDSNTVAVCTAVAGQQDVPLFFSTTNDDDDDTHNNDNNNNNDHHMRHTTTTTRAAEATTAAATDRHDEHNNNDNNNSNRHAVERARSRVASWPRSVHGGNAVTTTTTTASYAALRQWFGAWLQRQQQQQQTQPPHVLDMEAVMAAVVRSASSTASATMAHADDTSTRPRSHTTTTNNNNNTSRNGDAAHGPLHLLRVCDAIDAHDGWAPRLRRCGYSVRGTRQGAVYAAVSPDNAVLATAGMDRKLSMWRPFVQLDALEEQQQQQRRGGAGMHAHDDRRRRLRRATRAYCYNDNKDDDYDYTASTLPSSMLPLYDTMWSDVRLHAGDASR